MGGREYFLSPEKSKKNISKTKDKFWGMKKKIICGEGGNRWFKNSGLFELLTTKKVPMVQNFSAFQSSRVKSAV